MTIEQIAKKLNDCANARCNGCEFQKVPVMYCQQHMIKKMADECRRIAEEVEDDKR